MSFQILDPQLLAFFELSDRPRSVVYDPDVAPMPEGDEPLRSIMHKARVLAALGKMERATDVPKRP